ncbi:MAG: hypothetical protein M2R45_01300 [Verrucomicrobia subdivision 3 bacterium]|nr:hypothetical protein [Limisphaerales bacterium]MCS1415166.1 hypothetical protein [Limisphaerales bacterium]
MQLVAEEWLVYQLTGSAFALGLIRFLHTIPVTLFSVFAGGMAGRYDKRRLLLVAQTASMMVALILFGLMITDQVRLWHVGVLALALGVANAFDIPARQSFIVNLVGKRDLMNAVALNFSVFNTSRILGPTIVGLVIITVGGRVLFSAERNFVSFVILGYWSLRLRQHGTGDSGEGYLSDILSVVWIVCSTPSLRVLMGMVPINSVFGMSYTTLMPIFAEDIWFVGPRGLGALLAANGVGAFLGLVTLALLSHSLRRHLCVKFGGRGLQYFDSWLCAVQ